MSDRKAFIITISLLCAIYLMSSLWLISENSRKDIKIEQLQIKAGKYEYCAKSPIRIYMSRLGNKILISAVDNCKCSDIKIKR
jgi:hypothetical protein